MNNQPICQHCDGYWMPTERGMKRCTFCAKGASLAAADDLRNNPPAVSPAPTLADGDAAAVVGMLATIKMFPSDAIVRGVIGNEVQKLCANLSEGVWLADRMISLYDNWPGVRELRRVVCNSKIPYDGILATSSSEVYPDGIPSERPQRPEVRALPPGAPVTADRGIETSVRDLVRAKTMKGKDSQ